MEEIYVLRIVIEGKKHFIELDFKENDFECKTADYLTVIKSVPSTDNRKHWKIIAAKECQSLPAATIY